MPKKGYKLSTDHKNNISISMIRYCENISKRKHSQTTKDKISKTMSRKTHTPHLQTQITKDKISKTMSDRKRGPHLQTTKDKISSSLIGKKIGEDNPNWRGGITPKNTIIRRSVEYRLWRESVFARDNWTCCKCNIKIESLIAHHIKNFSKYPELRFAIDNGITFCKKCHQDFHKKYGIKNNTIEQINEFKIIII